MKPALARRFRCPKCGAGPGVLCEGVGGPRTSHHRERHVYAARVMAETRAFLEAVGPHGATEAQLFARGVDVARLDDTLERGWVELHQYPEESSPCYRLTESGRALLRRRR